MVLNHPFRIVDFCISTKMAIKGLFFPINALFKLFTNLEKGQFFRRNLDTLSGFGVSAGVAIVLTDDKATKTANLDPTVFLQFVRKTFKNQIHHINRLFLRHIFLATECFDKTRLVHATPLMILLRLQLMTGILRR